MLKSVKTAITICVRGEIIDETIAFILVYFNSLLERMLLELTNSSMEIFPNSGGNLITIHSIFCKRSYSRQLAMVRIANC